MLPGEAYKVYVSVFVEHRSDGTMLPLGGWPEI